MKISSSLKPAGRRGHAKAVCAGLFLLAGFSSPALADVTHELQSVTVVNSTGYVIDSDASNFDPLYNRDAIEVETTMEYSRSGASSFHYRYQFDVQLLDEWDVPQNLALGIAGEGTTLTVYQDVDLTNEADPIVLATVARVRPKNRLNPYMNYRAEVKILRRLMPVGTYVDLELSGETSPAKYKHFNQLDSDDAALNVIAEVLSGSWEQIYRVQTDPLNDSFSVKPVVLLHRYDKFNDAAPSFDLIKTQIVAVLRDDQGVEIPLENAFFDFNHNQPSYLAAQVGLPKRPHGLTFQPTIELRPVNQLLSRSRTYNVEVTVRHWEIADAFFPTPGNSLTTATERLLDFNGTLAFAGTSGTFTSIAMPGPQVGSIGSDFIQTSLRINNQSGSFQSMTFGDGGEFQVRLTNNGVATLSDGSFALTGTGVPNNPGNMSYTVGGLVALPEQFVGAVNLQLPGGLGVAADPTTRIHDSNIGFSFVALDGQLKPINSSLISSANRWAAEESKPFVFESSAIEWLVDDDRLRFHVTGAVEFVRAAAYDALLADPMIKPNQREKASNDGYYWKLSSVTSAYVIIDTEPVTGAALMSCDLSMGVVAYRGHFPDASVGAAAITQRITQDRVDTNFGGITLAAPVSVSYMRDCPDGDCGNPAGDDTLIFVPDGAVLKFTRDGGVAASGVLTVPAELTWGWVAEVGLFAQSASTFSDAGFHASGFFMAASQYANNPDQQPARLLLTGVAANGADIVERPGMASYTAGLGDYAGLNFRVVENGDQMGRMVLAGKPHDPFPLTERSKYYVRKSGVTGIHESVNGLFNPIATIYGVEFEFTTLGWAYRDLEVVTSRTAGTLAVQFPSNFDLEFEKLMISCQGALEGAEIAGDDVGALKKLDYWNADFIPFTLSFEGKAENICDPSERRLVLGVEAYAGTVPQPLAGRIGFQLNGNLVTIASGDLDLPFDSRFKLPNSFSLGGPGDENYAGTPVGDAYLNDWAGEAQNLPFGWMNISGYVDVPFFSDLEIHLHTSAVKDDDNALIYMMGGYPDHGFAVTQEGELKHFFNQTIFDLSNRGFPNDFSIAEYRLGKDGNEKYRPRAQKKWLGVVNFDYPLQWRPASRSFVSFSDVTTELLVLRSAHRVDYLSPEYVDVSFSAGVSAIPKISIANFVADGAGQVTGLLLDYLQTNTVDKGIQGLNEILDVKQREFFELALSPAIDATVNKVMAAVTAKWDAGGKQWQPGTDLLNVVDDALEVVEEIQNALTEVNNALGVIAEIDKRLGDAEDALTAIEEFIEEKDGKPLGDLESTVLGLAEIVSGALNKPEFHEKITELMKRGEPRIIQVRNAIVEVRDFIATVRLALAPGNDLANQLADVVNANLTSMQAAGEMVRDEIHQILLQVQPGVDSLPDFEATLRTQMKQRIADHMIGLPVIAEFNRIIKQRIYDTTALLTQAIDEVFDQINVTLKDIIREVAGGLDDKFDEMMGDIASFSATADIEGYAKIRNDSLTELRLDLKVAISLPDEMKAHVFLLIKELNSENSPADCLPPSGKATEVTIGAKDVSVDWLFPDLSINLGAKFVMESGGYLLGMGGGIDLVGEISFGESVIIKQLGASLMFGVSENYISAAAQIEVQGFAGGGGVYFGRACSLDPFFWDDTVAAVIGEPPFTGFYGYAEFWIPINQLIGIPSTCLFNLSAGVGAGAGVFAEGPTVFGKMFLGVSGDLLCIVSITGEISLVGVARPSGLSLAGEGRFQAELGYCPICLKFDKTARMVSENGKWSRSVN